MARRRTFHRPEGQRRYRRLFVIATEGAQTEPRYFAMFNSDQATIQCGLAPQFWLDGLSTG